MFSNTSNNHLKSIIKYTFENTLKRNTMAKEFKKGDLVRLRKGLIIGHSYGKSGNRLTLLTHMKFEDVMVIENNPDENDCIINGYWYPLTILEHEK